MSVCVLGSLNLDVIAYVAALPRPGETVMATRTARLPGGKGANQAVAAAKASGRTRLLGDDAMAYASERLARWRAEIEAWATLSRSVGFD